MKSRGQSSESVGVVRHIRPVAVSVLIGAVCCALVLLLMSVVMATQSVPQFAVDPMAILSLAAGGFVSGFCCARITRENGLAYGAICGCVLAVIVLLTGLTLRDNGFGIPALFKVAFVLLSSMLGGVVGVNRRPRRK